MRHAIAQIAFKTKEKSLNDWLGASDRNEQPVTAGGASNPADDITGIALLRPP
jgi:hypothetical protein